MRHCKVVKATDTELVKARVDAAEVNLKFEESR